MQKDVALFLSSKKEIGDKLPYKLENRALGLVFMYRNSSATPLWSSLLSVVNDR